MKIGGSFLNRLKSTYEILRKNIFSLIMPIFFYHILYFTIIWKIYFYYMIKNFGFLVSESSINILDVLSSVNGIYFLSIGFTIILLYLALYIPLLLGIIKGVKQVVNNKKVTIFKNIIWGAKNIVSSFKTYWYIFSYIYLVSGIIFITGGLTFIYNYFFLLDWIYFPVLNKISIAMLTLGFFIAVVSGIYRGLKTTFSIYLAVDRNKFNKNNFNYSIILVQNNWWRILGNFLLLAFLLGLIQNIFHLIIWMLYPSGFNFNFELINLQQIIETQFFTYSEGNLINILPNEYDINNNITGFLSDGFNNFSFVGVIIKSVFSQLINSVIMLTTFIFTYLFMKKLENEKK